MYTIIFILLAIVLIVLAIVTTVELDRQGKVIKQLQQENCDIRTTLTGISISQAHLAKQVIELDDHAVRQVVNSGLTAGLWSVTMDKLYRPHAGKSTSCCQAVQSAGE